MAEQESPQLAQLVEAVLASAKYQGVYPELIRDIGAAELSRRRNLKEAIKATKNKLHQVGGAYVATAGSYRLWLHELGQATQSGDERQLKRVCAKIMAAHASTRERLALLDRFYATTLADLTPIHSVLDVACGLNPLTIPWMPLAAGAEYYACDIYQDMIDFLSGFMALIGLRSHAQVCDAIRTPPSQPVDLAFVLKAIPCLEQVDKAAGSRLLETLQARHMLVSFPVHSLGGRAKGMSIMYEAHFRNLVAGKNWTVQRFEFATELAFLVTK